MLFKSFDEYNYTLNGKYLHILHNNSKGPVTSHLKINEYWINNTDYDYVIICEDDLSLETVKYWSFSWEEFFQNLPNDWECVQLCVLRDQQLDMGIKFRNRTLIDFGCQAYLIKRNYAEKMVSRYISKNIFNLDIPPIYINNINEYINSTIQNNIEYQYYELYPIVENIIYASLGKTYVCPLFVEDIFNVNSTFGDFVNMNDCHQNSYEYVLNCWKKYGQNTNIKDLFIGVTK